MSKAKSFEALKAEIALLEVQAAEARRVEIKGVIASIRESIIKYGITAADLGFKGPNMTATRARSAPTRPGTGVPKYRDPKSGKTWTGFGKPPGWISAARNRDVFLIDAGSAAATAGASASQDMPAVSKKKATSSRKKAEPLAAKAPPAKSTKAAGKATPKAGKAARSQPKVASKASSAATAKAAAGGQAKIAVRKVEGVKQPRPAQRKKAVAAPRATQVAAPTSETLKA